MTNVKLLIVTSDMATSAKRRGGHRHFPPGNASCYMLQGNKPGGAGQVIKELTDLGYQAEWHAKLNAVIVVIPKENLEVAGEKIREQLGFRPSGPSGWVNQRTRIMFGY